MTRQRNLLIGAGAFIIVSMLLVAAFSLGVYVGEHGWTRQGLSLQGPRPPQPGPGAPPPPDGGGQPGLPPGEPLPGGGPTLTGRIQLILRDRLELITPEGHRLVSLTPRTRIERDGRPIERSGLRQGQLVAVFGRNPGGRQALVADLIVLLPPPDQGPQQPRP